LVSILLPIRDAGGTLPACLASIRRQSFDGWECVVVDDGSRDGGIGYARTLAAEDGRFRIVASDGTGLVAALDTGLGHCRGVFVARMDGDDVMRRTRLAEQVAALEAAPALAAVGSHVRLFPRDGLAPGRRAYERWLSSIDSPERVRADAFVECPIAHPTLMIRTAVLRAFGYRDCGWPEDYDLVLRLLAGGHEIGVVPRRLLLWRDHARRLSRVSPTYALDRFTACKAAFLAESFLAGRERYVLCGYGSTGRALFRALLARGKRPSHVVELHPGRLGNVIHGAPVIPPQALRDLAGRRILVSVAHARPRADARTALTAMGFRELRDFVCAA
jgi:glycosyltransferase involved in cell wall biosynthesis